VTGVLVISAVAVDQISETTMSADSESIKPLEKGKIVLEARKIVKRYGHVTALDGANLELRAGEVLAVIGDNGAGKSTMVKVLCGAVIPDEGQVLLDGVPVHFSSPMDPRKRGIETVYQDLAVAPALDIATNLFLGREVRCRGILGSWFRLLDKRRMKSEAQKEMAELKFRLPSIDSAVEDLSGGQRQGVAVARSAIFARRLVIMDEPTAALGVRESGEVLNLIRTIRDRGLPVLLISHNMPHVFELADRIHIMRLGRRVALTTPKEHSMGEVVAIMTGAMPGNEPASGADAAAA
jgi:fructose transport system ATP-binding protein